MGADGDISAFAWYRATVELKTAGRGTLGFKGKADNIVVIVNGKRYERRCGVPGGEEPDCGARFAQRPPEGV